MNALVWKDIVLMRTGIASIGVFAVIFCLLFSENGVMSIVCSVLFSSLSSSSFAWDDQCQWNLYAVSAGLDRRTIVRSKVLSSVMFVAIGTVIGVVVNTALAFVHGTLDPVAIAVTGVIGLLIGLIVAWLSLAVNYVTGSSVKAQYLSVVVLVLSVALLVSATLVASDSLGGGMEAMIAVFAVIAVAVLALSYGVSCRKFEGRDL